MLSGSLTKAANTASCGVSALDLPFFINPPFMRCRLARRDEDQPLLRPIGTPGRSPGTFAMLAYQDAIPEKVHPQIDITFPAAQKDAPPVKALYELKERC